MKALYYLKSGILLIAITGSACKEEAVVQKESVITWNNPADIAYGTALGASQLNATADSPGIFVYNPPAGTVLPAGANQDLKVDFTPSDLESYRTASKTVKINVTHVFGTVSDVDGNAYKTITIGTQTWMAENLKTTKYRNGEPIPNVTDNTQWSGLTSGAYCWFNNSPSEKATYGALYNWYAASDSRNIAPLGWHVPTDTEWMTLVNYLGGTDISGGKLKESGTAHWESPNNGGTNLSGFTALGTGERWGILYPGVFDARLKYCRFWTSTSYSTANGFCYALFNYATYCNQNQIEKTFGLSIRCIKD